ncbi:hypothetical protein JCM3775_003734 [Rhodotorula graminis]
MATATTPKRPLTTTRSSRPPSPSKPAPVESTSVNNAPTRPPSRPSSALFASPGPSASADPTRAPSPTKRASSSAFTSSSRAPSPTKHPRASARLAPTASSSSFSLRSTASTSAHARTSSASSLAPSTSTSLSATAGGLAAQDEDDDRPRRRAGFGPPATPTRRVGGAFAGAGNTAEPAREEEEDEDQDEDDGTETETEEDDKDGKAQNVVVCLRVRPPKPGSSSSSSSSTAPIYTFNPATSSLSLAPSHPTLVKRFGSTAAAGPHAQPRALSDDYEFRFDLLHLHPSPTSDLYDARVRPVVRAALAGFNGTVFAYGQTASGKTFTMTGSAAEPGIIPLAIDELFALIHAQRSRRRFALRVAFLEIYNEQLRDLLAAPPGPGAPAAGGGGGAARGPEIVENGTVKGLTEREVALPGDVLDVLREGETRRRVGATDWNERSSRSHCVFIVTIESMSKKDGTARTSRLNLIDLAGSESATGQEERRKEGAFINKSLLTLGTVIGKLTDHPSPSSSSSSSSSAPPQHIPYRDSKLTRLLQPALSGNSRVAVVCTVSPDPEQAQETLSTLKFARRAKMVVTKAERGVLVNKDTLLAQYSSQIASLRSQIASLESASAGPSSSSSSTNAAPPDAALLSRLGLAEERATTAAQAVAEKDAELERLRALLDKTRSLVLTGPELERSARRVSGTGTGAGEGGAAGRWDELLSPSRSRSLRLGTPGARCASDGMGALGLGRPGGTGARDLRASVGGRLAEEDEGREKEAALTAQLAAAQASLADLTSTSASTAAELASLHAQLAHDASTADALRARVADLEASVPSLQGELDALRRERDELRAAVAQAQARCDEVQAARDDDARALEARLGASEGARSAAAAALEAASSSGRDAQDALRAADARLVELDAERAALVRRLAAQNAASGTRDEAVASLERQVASTQAELASVAAARDAAALASREHVSSLESERDLALKRVDAAEQRVRDVEELAALHRSEHVAAQAQTSREREAAARALGAELERVRADLGQQRDKVERLERRLEHYERLEAQRTTYERHRHAGTDALKTRLAELQARASTPVPHVAGAGSAPLSRSVSGASRASSLSASSASASTSATSALVSVDMEAHVELQVRNDELAARIGELERLAGERQDAREVEAEAAQREAGELRSAVDLQKRQLDETEARAEDWRQKYLAVQVLLDQLTAAAATSPTPLPSNSSDTENRRPSSLFLPDTSRASSTSRRPPLVASHSSHSRTPSSPGPTSSSSTTTGTGTGVGVGATWLASRPPPLPYSPHQRDAEAAAQRKKRRETIAKDLARLREGKVVGDKREGWEDTAGSPAASPSPTKSEFGVGAFAGGGGGKGRR